MTKLYILHGWSQNKNNIKKWLPFINMLKKKGINSEFLEIPGLDNKLNKVWTFHDYLVWLANILPKNENVILLGHSFGGHLSALFTAKYPNKVKMLILIDSSGLKNYSLILIIKKIFFYILAKIGKILFQDKKYRQFLYKIVREHDYEKADINLRRTFINIKNNSIDSELKNIIVPTLIIWGENDKITPLSFASLFNQRIKHSNLHLIKQARHSPQFTHVGELVKLIYNFIYDH